MPNSQEESSPLAQALARVGDRWTLLIVEALLDGPLRFNDLQERIGRIAPNTLSQRLRRLERDALVISSTYCEKPPRYLYELSASGRELAGALRLLADWGAGAEAGEGPRHAACGTPLEARWFCPTCEQSIDEEESTELHFA